MTPVVHVDCPTCGRVRSDPALATVVRVVKPDQSVRHHLTFACPACGDVCSALTPWPLTQSGAGDWLDRGADTESFGWSDELDDPIRGVDFQPPLSSDLIDKWVRLDRADGGAFLRAVMDMWTRKYRSEA